MKKHTYLILLIVALSILVGVSIVGAVDEPGQNPQSPDQVQGPVPAAWPDEPGAMPALIGGKKADRPMVFYQAPDSSKPQAVDKATIEVWYGDEQNFGQLGNPQQWVNILGNVSSPYGVKSISYSLNGGEEMDLTIGQEDGPNPRLANNGDFNVEIDYADLDDGENTVAISAVDYNEELTEKTVTVNYSSGNTWLLPYNADWGSSTKVQDIAHPVDGRWVIQDSKIIPQDIGYDRLLVIGDETWTDYDVIMPVTVKSLDDDGFKGVSNGPAVGMILRWQGHTQTPDPAPPEQPRLDWVRTGALGWYRWAEKNGSEGLELRSKNIWIGSTSEKVWEFGVPYFIRMSVQSSSGMEAYYRLKIWKQAEPEPVAWDLEGWGDEKDMQSGSLALIAHHVDVEFGLIQLRALKDLQYTATIDWTEGGVVKAEPTGQIIFKYGQPLTLTALAGEGNVFNGWSGDLTGSENPITIYMTRDVQITANFEEDTNPPKPGNLIYLPNIMYSE